MELVMMYFKGKETDTFLLYSQRISFEFFSAEERL